MVKILIDAMCAEFGGIRTYVEHLLLSWHKVEPKDEVHVVLRSGSTLATPGLHRHELRVARPDIVGRPWAQASGMHALINDLRPDIVLATAPTTDVRRFASPLAAVILDLRAELRPEQFSWGRRLLRKVSYGRTYQVAAGFLAISQRSLDDLHRLHPETRERPGLVTHLGADHVRHWPPTSRTGPAIAFAHHTNKNPQLAVEAWRILTRSGAEVPDLLLLGVSGVLRTTLEKLIAESGLDDQVRLAPYLPDDEFTRTIAEAAMIVFPSDFEGFGLPIVEGMALRKPVVIGPDPGSIEVAGGHAHVMPDWSAEGLAHVTRRALDADDVTLDDAAQWADQFSWEGTLRSTRGALVTICETAKKG